MNPLRRAVAAAARTPVTVLADGEWCRDFVFVADFPGFSGHFPGYPVVPAVVQVLTAQLVAEAGVGRPLRLLAVDNAKFLIQLRPDDVITVTCRPKKATATATVYEGTLSVAAGLAASFQMNLATEDAAC